MDQIRREVPPPWSHRLQGVLITEREIRFRVKQLAVELGTTANLGNPVVIALLNGSFMFLADLIREMPFEIPVDFIGVSSYRDGKKPARLVFTKALDMDIKNKDVLIVDDILDSGQTLQKVVQVIEGLSPSSIRTCVFLEKKRTRALTIHADFAAFCIPDYFVVGYGMDFAGNYRNLPFVGILNDEQV